VWQWQPRYRISIPLATLSARALVYSPLITAEAPIGCLKVGPMNNLTINKDYQSLNREYQLVAFDRDVDHEGLLSAILPRGTRLHPTNVFTGGLDCDA
jgi:hypothetical protein